MLYDPYPLGFSLEDSPFVRGSNIQLFLLLLLSRFILYSTRGRGGIGRRTRFRSVRVTLMRVRVSPSPLMAHINELIDFVVMVFIVNQNRVLLVDHKKLKMWMPVGGHIELNEDPEQALYREVQEECGLEIELIGEKRATVTDAGTKALPTPQYMDVHDITNHHKHVAMLYFARSKTDVVKLAAGEHNAIRWFTAADLADPQFDLKPFVRFYAEEALKNEST